MGIVKQAQAQAQKNYFNKNIMHLKIRVVRHKIRN